MPGQLKHLLHKVLQNLALESDPNYIYTEPFRGNKFQIVDLVKEFNGHRVLNGINLSVGNGESLVIIGGSGAGKSVLLKNMTTLMKPTSGDILFDGQSIVGLNTKQRDILLSKFGFLFQDSALFDSLNIWENVAFRLLNVDHMPKRVAKDLVAENLELVGLSTDIMDLYPAELSGGMQKRAALARAVISKPEVIFFDEPTTGLDPIMSDVINDLIVKTSKTIGATTITITHDMKSARKIADKIAMLYDSKIVWYGGVEEIDDTSNGYIRQFLAGSSRGPIKVAVNN